MKGVIKNNQTFSYVKQVAEKSDIANCLEEEFIQFLKFNSELCIHNIGQDFETLSGGEQTKYMISYAFSKNVETIILDEPTNNLDIENKRFLEQVLKNFKGNLLIVSHDKTFIDNVCDTKITIKDKKIVKGENYGKNLFKKFQ